MMSYGSIAFAGEFASGVARSAIASMDAAFAGLNDYAGAPLHRMPGAVHDRTRGVTGTVLCEHLWC